MVNYLFGNNCKIEETITEEEGKYLLTQPKVYYDERSLAIIQHFNPDNWDWIYNYMAFQQYAAIHNPTAYPCYLLDLGYVPVIFLPSFVVNIDTVDTNLVQLLDMSDFEYMLIRPTSFVRKRVEINTSDAWVHKMQAAKVLGCSPEQVRSVDIIHKILGGGII